MGSRRTLPLVCIGVNQTDAVLEFKDNSTIEELDSCRVQDLSSKLDHLAQKQIFTMRDNYMQVLSTLCLLPELELVVED
ncbi:hypothetical protein NQ315_011767 [Exocentrus adspersus]|uniref:Uncharacterized protein n=1 Tax=Exocentrus adspersus TaxID=1586481 RepID=A0AAV8W2F5_9CUCU|nr:hypothetical protein NQ315_011767 [Exocentrus adspersus]